MKTETKAKEMYNLQKNFGVYEVSAILGDLNSYKQLREVHSYKEIFDEIRDLLKV